MRIMGSGGEKSPFRVTFTRLSDWTLRARGVFRKRAAEKEADSGRRHTLLPLALAPSPVKSAGEATAALGSNRLRVPLPYLHRRMLVDPRYLETSPDRSGQIDKHYRAIAVERLCQGHYDVQSGAVEEGKQSEIEMHVSLGSQVDESFLEKGGCSEIELSVQAQASDTGEGRNLEHRHGVSSFRNCGTIRDDS